jgi:hypothetical protein
MAPSCHAARVFIRAAHTGDPLAPEIVPSDHCIKRYRERMPIRAPGLDQVVEALLSTLEHEAIITRVPPTWAITDRPTPLWAVTRDLAFPLSPTPRSGRFLAITCLRRT